MPKLMVGDIFRYKSYCYDFTAELVKREPGYNGNFEYTERIIEGNFRSPGQLGRSSSSEDVYIRIIKRKIITENLSTTTKNGTKIELNIKKAI